MRPRGGQPRTGKPARNRLVVLLDDAELAQLDAFVAEYGSDRSHWARFALTSIGALGGVVNGVAAKKATAKSFKKTR